MRRVRAIWMAVCGWAVWGACSGVYVYAAFEHPYGVNAWSFATAPQNYCRMWKDAHIDRWRVMCDWAVAEPTDLPSGSTAYVFNGWGNLAQALQSAKTIPGVRISVSVFNSPAWAQEGSGDALAYNLDKYADFLGGLLRYCDTVAPGVLEALEIENEAPTGTWVDSIPVTHGTSRRDPSWNVAAALKRAYATVQAHNAVYRATGSPVLVTPHGIWAGAYHHLDELYQLGCRGYFDRINLHDYRMDVGPADPSNRSIWNFDTVIAYHKHLADDNGDPGRLLWLTEFGWRFNTDRVWEHQWNWSMAEGEVYKASYTYYTLERSRRSGFVELTHIYVGITSGYNPPGDLEPDDTMGLIYTNAEWDPQLLHPTSAYYTYRSHGAQTLPWTRGSSDRLEPLTPASVDAPVLNGGFESGTAAGWAELREKLRAFPRLGVALETRCGPAVERLLDVGFSVYPLNPKAAQRYRDRKAPSGGKSDRLDARRFADALRMDGHGWRRLELQDPLTQELRLLCRDEIVLIAQRTALVNRLQEALHEYDLPA